MLVNVAQVVVFYLATYAYDYAQGQRRTEVGRNPLVEFNRRFGGAAVLLSIWAGYLLWRGGWFWRQLVVAGLGMQVFFVVALGLQLLGLWWAYWHYGHERKAVRVERPAYEAPDLAPWEMEYILREGKINVERSFLAYVVRQAQGKHLSFKENIVQIHGTLESSLPDIRRQTEGVFGQERLGFLPLYGVRGGWEKAIGTWLQEKKLLTVRPVLFRPWLGLVLAIGLSFLPAMVLLVFGPALGLFGWFLSRHDKLNGWWTIVVMITTPLLFFGSAAVALYLSNEFGWALDGFDSGPQRVLSLLAFSLLLLVPGYTLSGLDDYRTPECTRLVLPPVGQAVRVLPTLRRERNAQHS